MPETDAWMWKSITRLSAAVTVKPRIIGRRRLGALESGLTFDVCQLSSSDPPEFSE